MKFKTLLPTLAMLLFAATASAQSDPSTGGSFGTSFNHNAVTGGQLSGTVNIGQDASMTAPLPAQRSFWDRITGRNRSSTPANAQAAGHRHVWFGPQGTNIRGRSFHSNTHAQSNSRMGGARTNTSSSAKTHGWHLFGKR